MKHNILFFLFILFVIVLTGCKSEKEPIQYGKDACDHCKMLAMDPRFGAEIITAKGKIYKFDDINCMVLFMNNPATNPGAIAEIYVIDYSNPQAFIKAEDAFYIQSDLIRSPMASGVAAFATIESRYDQQQTLQGIELQWQELTTKFK